MIPRPRLAAVTAVALACGLASCMVSSQSRVANGQLYVAGKPQYDEYFRNVHDAQVEAAGWADDKKSTHKALVSALELTPDAPDVTIVQATHERASKSAPRPGALRLEVTNGDAHVVGGNGADAAFFHAVEDTAHAELERAKKMHAVEPRLDALVRTGHDLDPHVQEDYAKYGTPKVQEVKRELSASYDAVDKLLAKARGQARESEDFVADLQRAIETASEDHAKHGAAAPAAPATPSKPPAATREKPKREPKPAPPAGEAPAKPAPPPKPADTGEVFTP